MRNIIQQRLADAVSMDIPVQRYEHQCAEKADPTSYQKFRRTLHLSADIGNFLTRERERRALRDASSIWPNANFILINLVEEAEINLNNITVSIIPAWKWLLNK